MNAQLLDILCCPTSKMPLRLLRADELDAVNRALAGRAAPDETTRTLAAGLVTRDRRTIYRIEDDIPVMLADEAIGTTQLSGFPR